MVFGQNLVQDSTLGLTQTHFIGHEQWDETSSAKPHIFLPSHGQVDLFFRSDCVHIQRQCPSEQNGIKAYAFCAICVQASCNQKVFHVSA